MQLNSLQPNVLQPPPHLGPCATCVFWLAQLRDRWTTFQPLDQVTPVIAPLHHLVAQGKMREIDPARIHFMAPCSLFPEWSIRGEAHWCGQWQDCGMTKEQRFELRPPIRPQLSEQDLAEFLLTGASEESGDE